MIVGFETESVDKDGTEWVKIIAEIRKNETGEIVEFPDVSPANPAENGYDQFVNPFQWEENNYSCDCNRGIFFDRMKGCEKEWGDDFKDENNPYPCGEGKYSVRLKSALTGEYFYSEF